MMGTLLGLSWPMMARAWAPHSNKYSDIVMECLCGRTPTSDWETLCGQRRNNLPHNPGFTGAVLVCVCVSVCLLRALQLQYYTGGALFEQRSFLRLGLSEKVLSYNEQHMQTTTTTHHQPQRNNKSGPSVGPPQKIVETLKLACRTIFNTIKAHRVTSTFTIIKMCCLLNTLNT